ncbi:hypothetical protein PRK78_004467 [Emydomyces testavorans]|uniref:Uncharacterized protein n=1 Tax=Emydomyces testavorans TaxID=2070801 RepID=A0AAF0DIR3_9EURO|nr:hypothetical protein PRK78_004467 [Emydomyces testavorans]
MSILPIHTTTRLSLPCGDIVVTAGKEGYRATLPPDVASLRIIGQLSDYYQVAEYKTNAKSSLLNGTPIYTFGETIQRNLDGEPITAISNTSAAVINASVNPLTVVHVPQGPPVPLLVTTEAEQIFQENTGCRVLLSPEGGICETTPPGQGWVWYKKYIAQPNGDGTMTNVFCGTGIAPVKIEPTTGELLCRRVVGGALIFEHYEPAFGAFSAVRVANVFYLWGQHGEHIYLARVGIWHAIQRELYEFWNGYSFTSDMTSIVPVLAGYSHGSFFRTSLFGHCYGWGFIGATQSRDPSIVVGYAKEAAGPYQMTKIVDFKALHPTYRGSDCVYAHPWVFREKGGQLMVTWYEETSECVIGATLQFQMLHRGAYWKDMSLNELPAILVARVRGRGGIIEGIARMANVYYELEIGKNGATTIKFLGNREELDQATKNVHELIANWYKELIKGASWRELQAQGLAFEKQSLGAEIRKRVVSAWKRVIRPPRNHSNDENV